jgi:hypothetical protein
MEIDNDVKVVEGDEKERRRGDHNRSVTPARARTRVTSAKNAGKEANAGRREGGRGERNGRSDTLTPDSLEPYPSRVPSSTPPSRPPQLLILRSRTEFTKYYYSPRTNNPISFEIIFTICLRLLLSRIVYFSAPCCYTTAGGRRAQLFTRAPPS